MEDFDPTSNIGYLLQHLSSVLAKQSDQVLSERLGIGLSQYKILLVLQVNPRTRQRHIAERLGQTEASISRQISIMHDKNLLHTTINPNNRREHLTTPTAKGQRLLEESLNVLNVYHGPMFEALSEKQREQLLEILGRMHEHACQPGKTGACQHLLFSQEREA
jgi:DNA-binding MarR family transcriptional regulator